MTKKTLNDKPPLNPKTYKFEAIIRKVPDLDGAYVTVTIREVSSCTTL